MSYYASYLRSAEWERVRARKLAATNGVCEWCGKPATQVHHLNYDALNQYGWGREEDSDLLAMCSCCHKNLESMKATSEQSPQFFRLLSKWATRVHGSQWYRWPGFDFCAECFQKVCFDVLEDHFKDKDAKP